MYLTGSHTWQSLQDGILSNYTAVTQPFDYAGYLSLLQTNHHNFIRLWRWELTTHEPQPWLRTGPGLARDGKPRFDLRQFNQVYFDRLRSRVIAARERGIYVGIMLFEDWIFMNKRTDFPLNQHPFHKDNNVSGINGDPNGAGWGVEIHTLQVPAVLEVQKAYVRKVIQTVNDLDNVLYEICNVGVRLTREWQYEMVRFVKSVEAKLPKQHPVGMPSVGDMNKDCLGSGADWTSLATTGWDRPKDPWTSDPPAATGQMVCLQEWLEQQYNQSWLDMGQMEGPDGIMMTGGVWHRFNGKSLVWYPKDDFDAAGYTIPTTWQELLDLTQLIADDGDTAWCIGIESQAATGWPATDWTEETMLRTTSLENYDKWVKGELKLDSPEVRTALGYITNIWFEDKYVQGGRKAIPTIEFGDAPKPMFDAPPKCWLHRQDR